MNSKAKNIIIFIIISVIGCLITGIIVATVLRLMPLIKKDYAIVFDAGSSGTRMYIYEWRANFKQKDPLEIKQLNICITDVLTTKDNGIDKIKDKTELVTKFSKCIQKAQKLIPEERKNRTKISLAATAGMRLLTYNSPNVSNQIFNNIREYFSSTGFLFANDSQVKIITGRDEALNAWISANYFEQNFNKLNETKGIIDLGGASTQLVFVPKNSNLESPKSIRLFDKIYSTYSQSFLCYGINEATLMYRTHLINENLDKLEVPAHCFPKDSAYNLTRSQFLKSPCVNGDIYEEDTGIVDKLFQQDKNYYSLSGESSYVQCSNDIKKIFTKKQKCKTNENTDKDEADACTFENIFIADVKSSKFLALSSFWYAVDNMNKLWKKKFDYDIESFREATTQICSMNYTELVDLNAQNNAGIDKSRLAGICFSNVYVLELLAKYGFTSIGNVQVVDKIKGYTVGWTLGYLINELNSGNYLPDEQTESRVSSTIYLVTMISFLSLIALFVSFVMFLILKSNS